MADRKIREEKRRVVQISRDICLLIEHKGNGIFHIIPEQRKKPRPGDRKITNFQLRGYCNWDQEIKPVAEETFDISPRFRISFHLRWQEVELMFNGFIAPNFDLLTEALSHVTLRGVIIPS